MLSHSQLDCGENGKSVRLFVVLNFKSVEIKRRHPEKTKDGALFLIHRLRWLFFILLRLGLLIFDPPHTHGCNLIPKIIDDPAINREKPDHDQEHACQVDP